MENHCFGVSQNDHIRDWAQSGVCRSPWNFNPSASGSCLPQESGDSALVQPLVLRGIVNCDGKAREVQRVM